MYLEPNNPSLSFANFLDAAIRDKAEIKPFPYTLEVCRCRYCSYSQNGNIEDFPDHPSFCKFRCVNDGYQERKQTRWRAESDSKC